MNQSRDMYIDQDVIDRLRRQYGIKYVEGMKITDRTEQYIEQILRTRLEEKGTLSIGGEDGSNSGQLEEY